MQHSYKNHGMCSGVLILSSIMHFYCDLYDRCNFSNNAINYNTPEVILIIINYNSPEVIMIIMNTHLFLKYENYE